MLKKCYSQEVRVRFFIGADAEVCNKGRRNAVEDHKKLDQEGDYTIVEMVCRTLR